MLWCHVAVGLDAHRDAESETLPQCLDAGGDAAALQLAAGLPPQPRGPGAEPLGQSAHPAARRLQHDGVGGHQHLPGRHVPGPDPRARASRGAETGQARMEKATKRRRGRYEELVSCISMELDAQVGALKGV